MSWLLGHTVLLRIVWSATLHRKTIELLSVLYQFEAKSYNRDLRQPRGKQQQKIYRGTVRVFTKPVVAVRPSVVKDTIPRRKVQEDHGLRGLLPDWHGGQIDRTGVKWTLHGYSFTVVFFLAWSLDYRVLLRIVIIIFRIYSKFSWLKPEILWKGVI